MLSSFSKLADKDFVIGFLLPSLLGLLGLVFIFGSAPWLTTLANELKSDNPFADLTYLALAVWFGAVLLMSMNHFAYRLLEGYAPPLSWMGFLKQIQLNKLEKLRNKLTQLEQAGKNHEASVAEFNLRATYPWNSSNIMRTAFGNCIRAFELYPREVYGADGVSLWLRLGSVISQDFCQLVNDAKAQTDFFVNIFYIAAGLCIASVATLIYEWVIARTFPNNGWFPAEVSAATLAAAYFSYRGALYSVVPWGDLVKSAFDCYLPALAKQLGYELPATESKQREFWDDVSQLVNYRTQFTDGTWPPAAVPPGAR